MNLGGKKSLKAWEDLVLEWMQRWDVSSRRSPLRTKATEHGDWITLSPVATRYMGSRDPCSPESLEKKDALGLLKSWPSTFTWPNDYSKLQVIGSNMWTPSSQQAVLGDNVLKTRWHVGKSFKQWGSFHCLAYFPKMPAEEKENQHQSSWGPFTRRYFALPTQWESSFRFFIWNTELTQSPTLTIPCSSSLACELCSWLCAMTLLFGYIVFLSILWLLGSSLMWGVWVGAEHTHGDTCAAPVSPLHHHLQAKTPLQRQ